VITAVDTNVLLDLLMADREHGERSREAIRSCLAEGSLIACPVVWAEVATFFEPDPRAAAETLESLGVRLVPTDSATALEAAAIWQTYRRAGGRERRIAADFLVGAHARIHADRLLTRDQGFYRQAFQGLEIIDPSAS